MHALMCAIVIPECNRSNVIVNSCSQTLWQKIFETVEQDNATSNTGFLAHRNQISCSIGDGMALADAPACDTLSQPPISAEPGEQIMLHSKPSNLIFRLSGDGFL